MNNIKKYSNTAAYGAANKPQGEPRVSLVEGNAIIEGANVIVPFLRGTAKLGDHLYYDRQTGKFVFIHQDGFVKSLIDTTRYADARAVYCGDIDGDPLLVGVDTLGSKMFSQYSRCKLTGFDTEKGGTAKITASSFSCEFEYGAGDTYAEIAAAMTAAKAGDYKNYVSFEALEDGIGMKTFPVNVTVVSGDLTLTWLKAVKADGTEVDGKVSWDTLAHYCNLTEIGYNAMDLRGLDGSGCFHKKQYIEYIRTLGSATTFGPEDTNYMNEATFNALASSQTAEEKALYDKYNGNYNAYADVCASMRMIDFDAPYKTAETLRTGKVATRELAAVKLYDFDGTLTDAFPGPASANAYGINVTGFTTGLEAGNWHELGVGELSRIMRLATSRTTALEVDDVINRAIVAADGTGIYGNTTYQHCGASSANYQLIFNGPRGCLGNSYRITAAQVRVAPALKYPNS